MTKQSITLLGLLVVILAGVYFMTSTGTNSKDAGLERLLAEVEASRISKIRIEQSEKELDLSLEDGKWVLPSRAQYPANPSKVRSLLLKVMDLSSSQRIPATDKGVERLGLTDEALNIGRAKVTLYDAKGETLEGLYLGNVRKTKGPEGGPPTAGPNTSGQYVRRTSGGDIFLVGLPVMVSTELSNWLDAALMNVLRSEILEVRQFSRKGESFSQEFSITNDGKSGETLAGSIAEGKEPHKAMISSIASGLENVSIIDVMPDESEESAELVFDKKVEFTLSNAGVYTVSTAEKDGKFMARVEVRRDDEVMEFLSNVAEGEEVAKAEKEGEAESAEGEEAKAEAEKAKPSFITPEEVEALNAEYGKWVYALAEFQAQKFRRDRSELVQDIKTEDTAEVGKAAIENAGV